jgi:hypothetical protein
MADGLTYTGNIRSNKAHIPPKMRASSNREQHSSVFAFHDRLTLVSHVPKPGKSVSVISSMHHDKAVEGDAIKPRILHYNATKSGVENMDHLATLFTARRKTNRWPLVLFLNMTDVAGIAAYLVRL